MLQRLLNPYEEATNERLKALAAPWGAHPFVKIRLADVFPLDGSGVTREDYRFALQAHVDFVVTDADLVPLFAVEYDGRFHAEPAQVRRDATKARLCERFGLPLLRVNARYLEPTGNSLDLLGWFVHAWFSSRVVAEAEAAGTIPVGDVSPLDVLSINGVRGGGFPLWLSHQARAELWRLSESRPGMDPIPSCFVGEGRRGEIRALTWIRLDAATGVWAATGMRAQQFPVPVDEVVEDLAVLSLRATVDRVLEGRAQATPLAVLDAGVKRFCRRYTVLSYGGISPTEPPGDG